MSGVRVISGRFGRLRLETLPGPAVRPTADRVKEALFSILAPRLSGALVVDCFAGTGALGIEALSRGAERVVFVERARASLDVLRRNLEHVGAGNQALVCAGDALAPESWAHRALPVDLIVADPPYRQGLGVSFLSALAGVDALNPSGLLVLEHESAIAPDHPAWIAVDRRRYGDSTVSLYEASAPSQGGA